jgi:hypothetical protein
MDDVRDVWRGYEGRVIETQVDNKGCCLLWNERFLYYCWF